MGKYLNKRKDLPHYWIGRHHKRLDSHSKVYEFNALQVKILTAFVKTETSQVDPKIPQQKN